MFYFSYLTLSSINLNVFGEAIIMSYCLVNDDFTLKGSRERAPMHYSFSHQSNYLEDFNFLSDSDSTSKEFRHCQVFLTVSPLSL